MADNVSLATSLMPNNGVTVTPDPGPVSCWDEYSPDHKCYNIWRDFYFYAMTIIIPMGLICNSAYLGVFAASWMRRTIPGRYFMTLAIADNLVLLSELVLWLNTMDTQRGSKLGINFFHSIDALCKVLYFMKYGSRIWSSWVIVSITIERFLTVTFPFKVKALSSPNKVITVVLIEAVVCYSVAMFPFFTVHSASYKSYIRCLIMPDKMDVYHYMILVLIAGIGEHLLPSVLMFCFTALIIRKLYQAHRQRLRMSSGEAQSQRRQLQPTIALVLIALTFVIIRLPYLIMFYINQYSKRLFPGLTEGGRLRIYAMYKIAEVMAVTNYAINFFLFCMAGNTFREEMLKCYHNPGRQRLRRHQQSSISSTLTFRERVTSHIGMKRTAYGSASLRAGRPQEQVLDSNSDSLSGSFPPALDISGKVLTNGVEPVEPWR